ncbi:(E2-independent) E3 ubiquitin-conjugating enzyme FATS [Electrophorus electricus]|uniref:(E2-independent) E3 ubiquitin-conjugating enzyme FATS n=1 Tax=Electrophorus electricus TaxID=8005 RepID=UPI0015D0364D|nr:(E2-independent) E3 ubiquitin-conjugating enzyme FATS [Electrophorus electricus]
MDVKSESWRQLPEHSGQTREGCTSLHASPAWRRSGDKSYWESLVAQVYGPPRAACPQSEGEHTDNWLVALEQPQAHPTQPQLPAFAKQTAPMPALLNVTGTESSHHLDYPNSHCRERLPSLTPRLGESTLGSLESLESQSGLESREKAQIKPGPSTQKAKLCCLAPVQMAWLPLQRRVVMNDSSNHACGHDNSTNQVKQKPPITPVLSSSSVKANGSGPGNGDAEWGGAGIASGSHSPESTAGRGSPRTAVKERNTLSDGVQGATQDLTTRVQMPASENSKLPPGNLMRKTLGHRRGSAPQPTPVTAPITPKHSSSLSSITITSRMVARSSSLPDTSLPSQAGGREPSAIAINKPHTDLGQRKALVIKVAEHRAQTTTSIQSSDKDSPFNADSRPPNQNTEECYSSSFPNLTTRGSFVPANSTFISMKNHTSHASINIAGRDNHPPGISNVPCKEVPPLEPRASVVLRRKPTRIKVVEQRDQLIGERNGTVARPEHRHSYTGGLCTTSSTSYTNNPSVSNIKPLIANESSHLRFPEVGSAQPGGRKKEVREFHRSTLSVQLRNTNINPSSTDKPCSRVGLCPQRPASCYASLFSPGEPRAKAGTDPEFQSKSFTNESHSYPAQPTTSSSNRCWSTGGETGSYDKAYPGRENSAWYLGQRERACARPFTLIKVPESSAHGTHCAVLALKAAAVIANIKAQSQQRRRAQTRVRCSVAETAPAASSNHTEISGADVMHSGKWSAGASLPWGRERAGMEKQGRASFIPLQSTAGLSANLHVLSDALQPEFIQHSQAQVQHLLSTDTAGSAHRGGQ